MNISFDDGKFFGTLVLSIVVNFNGVILMVACGHRKTPSHFAASQPQTQKHQMMPPSETAAAFARTETHG